MPHQTSAPWGIQVDDQADFGLLVRVLYPWNCQPYELRGRDVLKDADVATQRQILTEAMSDLTDMHRKVLILSCGLDGQPERTATEVGRILDRSRGGIQSSRQRALRELRQRVLLSRHVRNYEP